MSEKQKFYWLSWYQPTEDHRPLKFPSNEKILGWWCSGVRCSDDASTLCAMVVATSKDEAKRHISENWPEAEDWRFCEESEDLELGDRFPLSSDWMVKRFCAARKYLRMNKETKSKNPRNCGYFKLRESYGKERHS